MNPKSALLITCYYCVKVTGIVLVKVIQLFIPFFFLKVAIDTKLEVFKNILRASKGMSRYSQSTK